SVETKGEGDGISTKVSWNLQQMAARLDDPGQLAGVLPLDETRRREVVNWQGPLAIDLKDGKGSIGMKVPWPPRRGELPPLDIQLGGMKGLVQVRQRTFDFGAQPAKVELTPDRLLIDPLPLDFLQQRIEVRVDLTKRADGRPFLRAQVAAPGMDVDR